MIKIEVKISGPRGCGKSFFLAIVEHVIHMIWRNDKITKREDLSKGLPAECLTVEIGFPTNPFLEDLKP